MDQNFDGKRRPLHQEAVDSFSQIFFVVVSGADYAESWKYVVGPIMVC
jgi:hypothetical protein